MKNCRLTVRAIALFLTLLLLSPLMGKPASAADGQNNDVSTIQRAMQVIHDYPNNNVLTGAMPCRGAAHVLVVDLKLENTENEMPTSELNSLFFGNHYTEDWEVRDENLTEYFDTVSYGKLHVTGVTVSHTVSGVSVNGDELATVLDDVLSELTASDFDANDDGFFDGIIFAYPDCDDPGFGAHVISWDYEYQGIRSIECAELSPSSKNVSTMAHEMVHMMGLPDIYGDVGVNMSGTHSDSVMEGLSSISGREEGTVVMNVPGIMKFFFGWIDDVVEVSFTGTYELLSLSRHQAMVIYPRGDTRSDFVFFVEFLTREGKDQFLFHDSSDCGVRIWRVLLNLNEDGEINGNSTSMGCGSTPYLYLDTLHDPTKDENLIFPTGSELSAATVPNTDYFLEAETGTYYYAPMNYTFQFSSLPKEFLRSGIVIKPLAARQDLLQIFVSIDPEDTMAVQFDPVGDTLRWSVAPDAFTGKGTLIAAVFDRNGKMMDAQIIGIADLAAGAAGSTVVTAAEGGTCKVFLLGQDMAPLIRPSVVSTGPY